MSRSLSTQKRARHSREFWQQMVAEQSTSGLSQRAFCEQHDLALSTFQWWRRRLKSRGPSAEPMKVKAATKAPDFVEIQLSQPAPVAAEEAEGLEVCFPSGVRLRIPSGWDGQSLLEVLWALEVSGSC